MIIRIVFVSSNNTFFGNIIGQFEPINTDYGETVTHSMNFGVEQPDMNFFTAQSLKLGISQGFNPYSTETIEDLGIDYTGKFFDFSNEATGLEVEGIFSLGDEHIKVKNGVAVLEGSGDVIAGSINCLDENFRHLMEYSHLSQEEALAAVTVNAAKSIGLTDRGEVKPGKRADIVILDNEHQVVMTIVNGKIVYECDWIDELKAAPQGA